MHTTYGIVLLLVREIFGVPVDLGLALLAVAAMLGFVVWGSRPSVIARYRDRAEEGENSDEGGGSTAP